MLTITPYIRDLLDQPRALRDTVLSFKEQTLPSNLFGQLTGGACRRVVLTGMGSSFHACHPLHQALIRWGIEAHLVETSELLHSLTGLLRDDSLVIAASQSGRSAEIVALLERLKSGKPGRFRLLGVSNTADSPLALGADACVLTRAGEESNVSCKTYLATLAALAWLEPVLAGESPEERVTELEAIPEAVEAYLSRWQEHVADLMERLRGVRDVFLVGRGRSLATAGTGGLIIKESTHVHSEGMSSAALRHGPLEMLSGECFVLVFAGQGHAAELNRRLYEDVLAAGSGAGWVAVDAPQAVFRIPETPAALLPVVEILPVQMMTLALAELRGHEAGRFTRNTKVTTVE